MYAHLDETPMTLSLHSQALLKQRQTKQRYAFFRAGCRHVVALSIGLGAGLVVDFINAITPGPRDEITGTHSVRGSVALLCLVAMVAYALSKKGMDLLAQRCSPSHADGEELPNRMRHFQSYQTINL